MKLSRGLADRTDRLDEAQARLALVALAMVSLVALAGCSSLMGTAGASVSGAHVEVTDENAPVMEFDYSVDDYSTVLLEGPDNEIINEKELSPENNHSSIYMGEPQEGEYSLVIQQGDETKTKQSVTFDGPDAEVTNVEAKWSGNTVESVVVTVENGGDLPVGVANASYSARGQSVDSVGINQWVEPNETATLEVATSYGSSVSIEEPGDVRGDVVVNTLNETLSGEFSKEFEGANLTITEINDVWSGNTLESAEVLVRNDGDLPTTANVSIDTESSLNSTASTEIEAGETVSYDLGGLFWNVETVRTGGTAEFEIIADSNSGYVSETFTHEIEAANVTIDSMTPIWEQGELTDVKFRASNNGELEAEFSTEVTVNGQTVDENSGLLDASTSRDLSLAAAWADPLYTVPEGGTYDVTLTLEGQSGWSTSVSKTTEFDGPSGEITGLDTYFIDNYDASTADLSSLSFDLQNTGDVVLEYDTIEVEIDGTTVTDNPIGTSLDPGESTYVSPLVDMTVSEGTQELTVRVLDGGDTVAETTITVSAGDGEK